jgi:hypothetical protein
MTAPAPRLIPLKEHRQQERGALAVAEYPGQIPFVVRRVFHIYDMPANVRRGGHAHRRCEQFLLCLHGALRAECRFPGGEMVFDLNSPRHGIYLPALTWLEFSVSLPDTVCAVLASEIYDPTDYVHDAKAFAALCTDVVRAG